jgi:uncharacterized membrane protein (DUF2068 family)
MKKGEGYLKLIIFYKTSMGIGELILTISFFNFFGTDLASAVTSMAITLHLNPESYMVGEVIKYAGMVSGGVVRNVTLVIFSFGVINLVESYGLHKRQRWAEWMTVVGTGLMIPYEIYEILKHVTMLKVLILIINSFIVYYLASHKELFHSRREQKDERVGQ